ncbi:MAG: radical SAM protein [Planctomycetes bacterium]|nr:radical SAM protein [Planctomycetota bacterium]
MYQSVLCIYPYRDDIRRRRYYPPMGLEVIAGALSPYVHRIDLVDLRHEPGSAADYVRPETDVVCFSVNWDTDPEFVRRQIDSVSDGRLVVVGGRHASEAPEKWMADCPGIDVLVRGDGEEAIVELARGVPLAEIPGVSWRDGGSVVHNPIRHMKPIRDDCHPQRRMRRTKYRLEFRGVRTGIAVDTVASSRGCPFNCRFCSFNLNPWGEKRPYSTRSVRSVVDELEEVDADLVVFTDDIFTHDMDRVGELCDEIRARGIRKRYVVNSRIEVARHMDVVRKMEEAGFVALFLGVESAQDKTLRAMRKGFDTSWILKHFEKLRKTRMLLHGYFILGCIGETEEEMLAIAPFARRLGLDTLGLSLLRTTPHDALTDLIRGSPGYHVSTRGYVYSDEVSHERLRELRRIIWRRFYTPSHVLKLALKCIRARTFSASMVMRIARAEILGVLPHRSRRSGSLST